jgi:hypothetical protein
MFTSTGQPVGVQWLHSDTVRHRFDAERGMAAATGVSTSAPN